ncbi:MutS protein msh4, partial [Lunasporangiospora selenospora]
MQQYIIKEGSPSLLLGIPTKYYCLSATAALMRYIEESHNAVFLSHSIQFKYQICQGSMVIDCATARNLELTTNILRDNDRETLFGILNETSTSMGARLLRSNILQPLTDEKTIATRLDCVQELCGTEEVFMNIKRTLKTFTDIDRLITSFVQVPSKPTIKHSEQNINHIINLKHTLRAIGNLTLPVRGLTNRLLCTIHRLLTDARLEKFADLIDGVVEQSVVLEKTAVGLRNQRCFAVKAGCNGLLDVARQTYKETINDIFGDVNRYVDEYGIHLKVEFNLTMGYYLSTSVDNLEGRGLPPIFINVIRKGRILTFTTLELVKRNAKVNDSLTEVYLMSDKIIAELSSGIRDDIGALYKVSEAVAMLDMLMAFTHLCTIGDYVRPEFSSDMLVVKQGRHPIIEKLYSTPFVANDTFAGPHNTFHIITGPNMSGKSTYLKQIALLTIMAQIGCYVPAEYASFRIMDQLFSRICNDDSIELNSSTFMIEMKETTYILQNVTEKSLVVIDELGRGKYTVIKCAPILLKVRDNPVEPKVVHETGTSIYDGLGIAFAVCEELIHTRAFIFFTTHFQELTYGLSVYHNVVNLHLDTEAVCDSGDTGRSRMVYKYRVTGGVAQKEHYGVLLAQSLGLPQEITLRAEAIAQRLSDLQENARQRSESDKVVSRRRSLAR